MAKGVLHLNVEFSAVTDEEGKFGRLAKLLGLADADHARGKCEHLWLACTRRGEHELPQWLVEQVLGEAGPEALVDSELAGWAGGRGDSKTRRLRIGGAAKHCLWLTADEAAKQEQRRKGGKTRADKASRQLDGTFVSAGCTQPADHPAQSSSSASATETKREGRADDPRPRRLDPLWAPADSEANRAAHATAKARGIDLEQELLNLHNWAKNSGKKGKDWDARWRLWISNAKPKLALGTWSGQRPKTLVMRSASDEPDLSYDPTKS